MYLVCRLLLRPPPTSTLFPYTTLFRSRSRRRSWSPPPHSVSATGPSPPNRWSTPMPRPPRSAVLQAPAPPTGPCSRCPCTSRTRRRGSSDRKSTRLNSSHRCISYAVFCFGPPLPLHSFPTRRSSDLVRVDDLGHRLRTRFLPPALHHRTVGQHPCLALPDQLCFRHRRPRLVRVAGVLVRRELDDEVRQIGRAHV